jgi:hypothetical protein
MLGMLSGHHDTLDADECASALMPGMGPMAKTGTLYRAYAEMRPDGRWEAVCLDFDIAVEGASLDEAVQQITKGVREYLDYVDKLPAEERRRFLRRRVPLSVRLSFAWRSLTTILLGRLAGDQRPRADLTLSCPA